MNTDKARNWIQGNSESWVPHPADKYLPIWVIAIMFLAVWVLSASIISSINETCKIPNRCYMVDNIRGDSKVADVVGSAVRKAAEAKVSEAIAPRASALPVAAAPDDKAK